MTLIEDKKGRPASILGYFRNKTKNAIFSYLECPCGWYVIICYIYMYIIVKNMTYLILKKLSALSVKYFCYCATLTLVERDFFFDYEFTKSFDSFVDPIWGSLPNNTGCGVSHYKPISPVKRVVGGEQVAPNSWPWMVRDSEKKGKQE